MILDMGSFDILKLCNDPRITLIDANYFWPEPRCALPRCSCQFLISANWRNPWIQLLQHLGGILEARHEDHGGDDEGLVAGLLVSGNAALLEDALRDLAL